MLHNKHIPDDYKYTSRDIQIAVLAGLIDSDGYCNKVGYDICLVNQRLRDDIADLCSSLGYHSTKTTCDKTCTNSSKGPVTGTYYRLFITGNDFSDLPLLLTYKRAKARRRGNANIHSLEIWKLENEVDIYEITVDGNCLMSTYIV